MITPIFGAYPMVEYSPEERQEFLQVLKKYGVRDIDTAAVYPSSEHLLGQLGAPKDFIIHTKAASFSPGKLGRSSLISSCLFSLYELKVDQVDVYFLHSPDADTPLTETLAAVQEVYLAGKFKRFGLSNFLPDQVQEVYDICKKEDYILPTVYQGNYNPVARKAESALLPLLRKLGMSFFAYSPLAGGFLTKKASQISEGVKGGRFDKDTRIGQMYHNLYNKPSLLKALDHWEKIAKEAGVSQAQLAYRWVTYHSALSQEKGDGIIVGASRPSQLEETLKGLDEGPLSDDTVKEIEGVWDTVKDEVRL